MDEARLRKAARGHRASHQGAGAAHRRSPRHLAHRDRQAEDGAAVGRAWRRSCDAAVETVGPTAEKKQLELEVQLDESLPPVSGDPVRLQQVVSNLLTNAIKFTPERGRVTVTVDSVGRSGRIRVTDTGIGIEPEFLPHIFDRFSQEDAGRRGPTAVSAWGSPSCATWSRRTAAPSRRRARARARARRSRSCFPLMKRRAQAVPASQTRELAAASRQPAASRTSASSSSKTTRGRARR